MLSPDEKKEILTILTKHEHPRGACIEALKIVQKYRHWISDESLADIAAHLGMSCDELDHVATFYNLIFRRPVGRHVILLCNSVSCWIMGYPQLKQRLTQRLGIQFGETTIDNRFTLLPNVCLGACDHAPALMIDEDLYEQLDPKTTDVDTILEKYP